MTLFHTEGGGGQETSQSSRRGVTDRVGRRKNLQTVVDVMYGRLHRQTACTFVHRRLSCQPAGGWRCHASFTILGNKSSHCHIWPKKSYSCSVSIFLETIILKSAFVWATKQSVCLCGGVRFPWRLFVCPSAQGPGSPTHAATHPLFYISCFLISRCKDSAF